MLADDRLSWRENDNIPPAGRYISSPYDPEAHYANKHSTQWIGYKVHLTETCDADRPNLITHVETTAAPVADDAVTASIHAGLAEQDLLPAQHIADPHLRCGQVYRLRQLEAVCGQSKGIRD